MSWRYHGWFRQMVLLAVPPLREEAHLLAVPEEPGTRGRRFVCRDALAMSVERPEAGKASPGMWVGLGGMAEGTGA